jgi:hypothetical protein
MSFQDEMEGEGGKENEEEKVKIYMWKAEKRWPNCVEKAKFIHHITFLRPLSPIPPCLHFWKVCGKCQTQTTSEIFSKIFHLKHKAFYFSTERFFRFSNGTRNSRMLFELRDGGELNGLSVLEMCTCVRIRFRKWKLLKFH